MRGLQDQKETRESCSPPPSPYPYLLIGSMWSLQSPQPEWDSWLPNAEGIPVSGKTQAAPKALWSLGREGWKWEGGVGWDMCSLGLLRVPLRHLWEPKQWFPKGSLSSACAGGCVCFKLALIRLARAATAVAHHGGAHWATLPQHKLVLPAVIPTINTLWLNSTSFSTSLIKPCLSACLRKNRLSYLGLFALNFP